MNSRHLSKQHLSAMAFVVERICKYLFKVLDRMNRTGFPADDDLRQAVTEAYTSAHKLWLSLTYGPYKPTETHVNGGKPESQPVLPVAASVGAGEEQRGSESPNEGGGPIGDQSLPCHQRQLFAAGRCSGRMPHRKPR